MRRPLATVLTGEYRPASHRTLEEEGPLPIPTVRGIVGEQLAPAS